VEEILICGQVPMDLLQHCRIQLFRMLQWLQQEVIRLKLPIAVDAIQFQHLHWLLLIQNINSMKLPQSALATFISGMVETLLMRALIPTAI